MIRERLRKMFSALLIFGLLAAAPMVATAIEIDLTGVPTLGPSDAPVKVILFYDFQCPYCKKTAPIVMEAVKPYGDKVLFASVNVPSPGHPYALPSAELALTAHDVGKYWEAMELLFANQSNLANEDLVKYGNQLGLDEATVKKNLENNVHLETIKRDFYLAVNNGVTGTPSVFVGDKILVGVQKKEAYQHFINKELKAKGIESPIGEVALPETTSDPVVPKNMIFPVKVEKPTDSKVKVKVGKKAPDFTLPTLDGKTVTLSSFKGQKNVVISFVPAAWTPVCSAQWPEYSEMETQFDHYDTTLIGITVDNIPTLYSWTGTMGNLWFKVASDFYPHGKTASAYGILRSSGVSERAVILVDKQGIVRYVEVHDINSKPDFADLKKALDALSEE
jgi:peroxiredoxin/protein-disulfide isomerase